VPGFGGDAKADVYTGIACTHTFPPPYADTAIRDIELRPPAPGRKGTRIEMFWLLADTKTGGPVFHWRTARV
jgi:hypothetical protein